MTFRWWERWGSLAGALAVVCWIVSFAIAGSNPSTDDGNAKITSYYVSHSHQVKQITGWFFFVAGVLLFVVFLAALRERLLAVEGQPGRLSALAFGAGLISAALWIVAISLIAAPAFMTNDTKPQYLDANTYRMVGDLGYEVWVAAVIAGAVVVWATSAVALRSALLPRWFAWIGVVVGVILLFAVLFIPTFVYWGWILVTAALLMLRRPAVAPAATPAT